jgi:hypothetical protein
MNEGTPLTPMERAMHALKSFFGKECREFDLSWHARDLANGTTQLADYWEWVVYQIEADRQTVDDVIRAAMTTVQVNVKMVQPVRAVTSDHDAAGLYKVAFGKDVCGMSRAGLAAVALDIFRATRRIACADDLEIDVVDGAGNRIEVEAGHRRGEFADYGTVENIAEPYEARQWIPTLYIEAMTRSESAQFDWARVRLMPALIARLRTLQQLCLTNGLTSVQTRTVPISWPGAAGWQLVNNVINVSGESVWFTAATRDGLTAVETKPVPLATLFELLATARNHEVDPSFGWRLGDLYYHGIDSEVLIEKVQDQAENSGE